MKRIPPKQIATTLAVILKDQNPDANYIRKTFEYIRDELNIHSKANRGKKLPELLTEEEINRFYKEILNTSNRTHMIMVKLLIYTGIRNAELVNIKLKDVNLNDSKIFIRSGKGKKDRQVPIPKLFKGELTQYKLVQEENDAIYLFETNRHDKFSTRWVREIIKGYAIKASIEKRIYPHLFRHQLLTFLTKKGIIDSKIQLISGHEDRNSLSIYQDLSLKDIEDEYNEVMQYFPIQ